MAMLNLGKLYAETGDYSKAALWWKKAAEMGDKAIKTQVSRNLEKLHGQHPGLR